MYNLGAKKIVKTDIINFYLLLKKINLDLYLTRFFIIKIAEI